MGEKLLTVLMPVYNGEKFLRESIDSVLSQTYSEFEFLIIDDGSTDTSPDIIRKYAAWDSRIHVITNPQNCGVTKSLNIALDHVNTEYLARMDADDICLPFRFAKQLEVMEGNRDIGVCGSFMKALGEGKIFRAPVNHSDIKIMLAFGNCLNHPSVMLRTLLTKEAKYDESFLNTQDYELWTRLIVKTRFYNIPEPLLLYRRHKMQISTTRLKEQHLSDLKICSAYRQKEYPNIVGWDNIFSFLVAYDFKAAKMITFSEFDHLYRETLNTAESDELEGFLIDKWGSFFKRTSWKTKLSIMFSKRSILLIRAGLRKMSHQ